MELVLNQNLCIRCGRCTGVCPTQVMAKKPDGAVVVVQKALGNCIQCGQCVAACPKGALMLNGITPESLRRIEDAPLSTVQRDMLFKARRSVRMYKDTPVDHELLFSALEDARYAPTAGNSEDVEWILVEGRDKLRAIGARVAEWARHLTGAYSKYAKVAQSFDAGLDPILRGAPALIFTHSPASSNWAVLDCTAAISYLELALHSRGIGTCWAGYVLAAASAGTDLGIPLPAGRTIHAGLMIGYPSSRFERIPPRKPVRLVMA